MASLRVQNDTDIIYFEGVQSERFVHSAAVTEHPIENRQNVIDHRQQAPLRVTVEGITTAHPLIHESGRLVRAVNPEADVFGDPIETFGNARLLQAVRFFENNEDRLFEYVSIKLGVVSDLLIESWAYDVDNESRLVFEIELIEVRFGRSEIVDLPPIRRRPSEPNVDVGDEDGTEVEDDIKRQTILFRLDQTARGAFE